MYTKGTGHNTFVRRGLNLSGEGWGVWGCGVIEDTTQLKNITDKVFLGLKFELTEKHSASKSQHCY